MKKIIVFAILLLGVNVAKAQISQGNVLVGANVADLNLTFDSQTSFQFTPKAAWFIRDGLAVGAYGQFGLNHVNGQDGNVYTYGVGPLARYFVGVDKVPAFRNTKFFVEANTGFQGISNRVNSSNTTGLGFGFGPGISYFITPSVGIEGLLKYDGIVGFGSSAYTHGLSFGVGFQIYLPSKKLVKEIKDF
ncbi:MULTISPECIES: outer membrane beta-barrel protein [unclassified Dysgonomonas]|uniref:outer membrane beta-barrel protein n=1 Tax=unclassified Dysgonomonas TaxID=2630389 RepID=UPI0013ED4274|nr:MULTISPECIES: outer membrane beta-barrel protein [unclassified Dysgonomonas]